MIIQNNYKTLFIHLYVIFFLFSSCQLKKIKLGRQQELKSTHFVQPPVGSILRASYVNIRGVKYNVGVTRDNRISYVSTNHSAFKIYINNSVIDMNTRLIDIVDDLERLKYKPGWGYYVKINPLWYACFDYKEKPSKDSKVISFFKYKPLREEFNKNSYLRFLDDTSE